MACHTHHTPHNSTLASPLPLLLTAADHIAVLCCRLHDRLPLILDEDSARIWLDTDRYSFADCLKFIRPTAQPLVFYAVSDKVNYMRNKGLSRHHSRCVWCALLTVRLWLCC